MINIIYNEVDDGTYNAIVTNCHETDRQIFYSFELEDGRMFHPDGINKQMTSWNPILKMLRHCGWSDQEIITEFRPDKLIGTLVCVTIRNKKGHSRCFCNIVDIEILDEDTEEHESGEQMEDLHDEI